MSTDLEALARRAVACKGWRWMPGMRTPDGMCIMEANGPKRGKTWHFLAAGWDGPELYLSEWENATTIPDLADPATLGCLLALVRAAWAGKPLNGFDRSHGLPMLSRRWEAGAPVDWRVSDDGGWGLMGLGATEAEALVAALEAAP